jgi:hypothetical protein
VHDRCCFDSEMARNPLGNRPLPSDSRPPIALRVSVFWTASVPDFFRSSPRKGPKQTVDRLITVQELCGILGISKTRLYSLIQDGILPEPKRNPSNNRPIFDAELTETCRQVFKTRIGINGRPYTPNRRRPVGSDAAPKRGRHEGLIASLSALGLTATTKQVDEALKSLPDAGKGMAEEELVRRVFLLIHRNP